jgi:hypothetical protein
VNAWAGVLLNKEWANCFLEYLILHIYIPRISWVSYLKMRDLQSKNTLVKIFPVNLKIVQLFMYLLRIYDFPADRDLCQQENIRLPVCLFYFSPFALMMNV